MSAVVTTQPEVQTGRKLQIASDVVGAHTFFVDIRAGGFWASREVTVEDDTIDIADLIRKIVHRDYEASNAEMVSLESEGSIFYYENGERSGRHYLVGKWTTVETQWEDDPDEIFVEVEEPKHEHIDSHEVDTLVVERTGECDDE